MECLLETEAATILEFIQRFRGTLSLTFEGGTSAAWLHDLQNDMSAGSVAILKGGSVAGSGTHDRRKNPGPADGDSETDWRSAWRSGDDDYAPSSVRDLLTRTTAARSKWTRKPSSEVSPRN